MPSLQGVVAEFSSVFVTEVGVPFLGKIMPAGEGEIPNFLFSFPRLVLRTPADAPVVPRDLIQDEFGRRHLVAAYDAVALAGAKVYQGFQLFQVDREVSWTRAATTTDLLTGLPKPGGSPTSLGPIRAGFEVSGREFPDRASNAREETIRVITGANVLLNDKVDGKIVKRVTSAFGITIAEIQ